MNPTSSGRSSAWASDDDMMVLSLIVIVVGLGLFGYLAWSSYHGEISAAVIAWRRWEIGLLSRFTDAFAAADRQMAASNPYGVSVGALYRISNAVGAAWRLPACVVMAILGGVCMFRAAPSRYRRRLDPKGLAVELGRSFTSAAAFIDQGLKLVSPGKPVLRPADYALTAEEWIERYALGSDGEFDERRASSALISQLGARWTKAETASIPVLVVYVAFSLHLFGRRDEALRLLGEVGDTLTGEANGADGTGPRTPLEVSEQIAAECRQLLRDHAVFADADAIMQRHAWTTTALMSLLNTARMRSGVLAPAQFAWLKLVDRPLWYALQSLGFETEGTGRYLHPNARVEAAGARDHWAVERAADIPILEPSFDRALVALQRHARLQAQKKASAVRNRVAQGQGSARD